MIRLVISPLNWSAGLCCFRWHVNTYNIVRRRCEGFTTWMMSNNISQIKCILRKTVLIYLCVYLLFFFSCAKLYVSPISRTKFSTPKNLTYRRVYMVSTIFTDTVKSFNILQDVVIQTHVGNPSILQTTWASALDHRSSQTVPQVPP